MRYNLFFNSRFLLMPFMALALTACQQAGQQGPDGTTGNQQQDNQLSADLSGAGASFPAPVYERWFREYQNSVNSNVKVSYQAVGSGSGVEQYLAGTVDFGASDAPLTDEERAQFQDKYNAEPIQIPTVSGAVVMAYNLPEIEGEELKLSRDAYCGIVTGNITSWDNPEIADDNPNLDLPNEDLQWIHRSDGSGTNFIFTNHINTVCDDWNAGAAKSVDWPAGQGANGNQGLASQIQQTEGAIGYVEFAYAKENDIPMASLENESGNFIEPTADSASLAFKGAEIPDDFTLLVPNPENPKAYPIAGVTWLLIYPEYEDANKYKALKRILEWSYDKGEDTAVELGYVPMPDNVVNRAMKVMENDVKVASQQN